MAIIVLLFAWQTRRAYPRWFNIAAFVSTSVVLSTMVLGIHWVSDVVAGVALGTWCVVTASWIVERVDRDSGTNRSVDETSLSSEVDD
jgi:membrane-associated phospholipid phosphatase